jgi:hypothetical protein
MKMRLTAALVAMASAAVPATAPRFDEHDPVTRVSESRDASAVRPVTANHDAEGWQALRGAGNRSDGPARDLNTVGDVPDSSWFTNRIGSRPMSIDEIVRGPDSLPLPPTGPWTVVGGKTDGVTPGLRLEDREGRTFFVKFDPRDHPELASGAEIIATKLFFALGYNVPENYIVRLRPDELTVAPDATIKGTDGVAHRMTRADVHRLLEQAARHGDGSYRVLASLRLPGTPVGPFRYSGNRPDDPNDLIPHEHRRELRALRVFAAWLNHVDTKSQNTMDTLVRQGPHVVVRHHLLDFGSTLGSAGTGPKERRHGFEYLFEGRRALLSLVSFGTHTPEWERVHYPALPSVGRFAATAFHPETWKPTFPNPAFDHARPDDLFWGAQRVMAVSDEAIRAVVGTARFSDPAAAAYLARVLMARRDEIGRALLPAINPVVQPAIAGGRLTFRNAAVEAAVADAPPAYAIRSFAFDNTTGTLTTLAPWTSVSGPEAPLPPSAATTEFIAVQISADHPRHPSWATPACAYFRRGHDSTWSLIGFERLQPGSEGGRRD